MKKGGAKSLGIAVSLLLWAPCAVLVPGGAWAQDQTQARTQAGGQPRTQAVGQPRTQALGQARTQSGGQTQTRAWSRTQAGEQPRSREQKSSSSRLTLERIFSSRDFTPERFGPARWLADGSAYTTLEPSKTVQGGRDIVRFDAATGAAAVLVPSERLIPPGASKPLWIADYSWSRDGKKLLVFTNTRKVWRYNTRGDYWVLDLDTKKLKKIGGAAPPASLMFAKFSPGGTRVSYVRANDLFVEDLASGEITFLTTGGSPVRANGTSDWVYEEEFSLRDGSRWSPDGRSIAYWQIDDEGVGVYTLVDDTDSLYPRLKPVRYPKAGTTNPSCRIGVVSASGGKTTWIALPGDDRDNYIPRMEWAGNSGEIVFERLNRLQNTLEVMIGDARTGAVRAVLTERDAAWVDVVDRIAWLDGGASFLWLSERDGWRHAYRVPRSGGAARLLTPGPYDVIDVAAVDEAGGRLYFIASPGNATRRFLYSVPLDGTGKAERMTPQEAGGSHRYDIAPGARFAFHTSSSFGTPPATELVSLPDHETIRTLAGNTGLRRKVNALDRGPAGFFRVDIGGGVSLDGWMIRPPGFDPGLRHPVLFYVYGEPAGTTVRDAWGGAYYLWHLLLAQEGYAVMSVDNRGTPAPRGRAWRKCIYRKVGILAPEDQAAALRAIEKRWPWVDGDRVGIWGWSGGGSMSLDCIFRHPELYKTAMAVAAVSDQRFYDTIYQERYMGLPKDNEEGYRLGSPLTWAHRLEGNLLVVHGTGDDNCHFQSLEALVNELVARDKPFTMMAYPGRTHDISEGRNTRRHLFGLLTRFLKENLPPGPRPR